MKTKWRLNGVGRRRKQNVDGGRKGRDGCCHLADGRNNTPAGVFPAQIHAGVGWSLIKQINLLSSTCDQFMRRSI